MFLPQMFFGLGWTHKPVLSNYIYLKHKECGTLASIAPNAAARLAYTPSLNGSGNHRPQND
jgi:hypothetical protein